MKKERKDKHFLNTPQYPGGKKAFGEFIRKNLRYPEEALQNRIEGKVHVSYQVNDNGEVLSVQVTHGLGYGCDEEAIRLIRLLKYDKVKNRGLRLISTMKTSIQFRLPRKPAVQVTFVPEKKEKPAGPEKGGQTYGYTIKF